MQQEIMNNVPLSWVVAYWEDSQVVFRGSGEFEWADLPTEDVLWVDLKWGSEPWRQRLHGRDNFWLHDGMFGMFPDPEHANTDPSRTIITAWSYDENGSRPILSPTRVDGVFVPAGAHVLVGELLPDDAWEEVMRAYPLVLA